MVKPANVYKIKTLVGLQRAFIRNLCNSKEVAMRPYYPEFCFPEHDKYLFVCTNNKHRSVTAATMYNLQSSTAYCKSAGLSPSCDNPVTQEMVNWADKVFCFEDRHRTKLRKKFGAKASNLSVPDEFYFYQPELVRELRTAFRRVGLFV